MGVMSIREFNANISRVLARVEAGEDIVLTRQGKRAIRLTREGVEQDEEQRAASIARLRELMDQGFHLGGPATYDERTGVDRLL